MKRFERLKSLAFYAFAVALAVVSFVLYSRASESNSAREQKLSNESITSMREELWAEANKHRKTPLALDPVLNDTAQDKCKVIVETGNPDHGDISMMADNLGRHKAGENLAHGYSTAKKIVDAWAASPTHNTNLVDSEWTRVGYGICSSTEWGLIVVQHFSD